MKILKSTVTENSNQISEKERLKPPNLRSSTRHKLYVYFTLAFVATFNNLLTPAAAQPQGNFPSILIQHSCSQLGFIQSGPEHECREQEHHCADADLPAVNFSIRSVATKSLL